MRVRWFVPEKKDCSVRLCIDYSELNKKIMPERMLVPRIQDVLENVGGHKYFSTLDTSKAYRQGFMHKNSQHYSAFTSPWGLYEWLRINSTPIFSTIYQPVFIRTERFDMHTVP